MGSLVMEVPRGGRGKGLLHSLLLFLARQGPGIVSLDRLPQKLVVCILPAKVIYRVTTEVEGSHSLVDGRFQGRAKGTGPSNVCSQDSVQKDGDPTLETGRKGILAAL